ncbi:MAG: MFS transporter, partial [Bacteroidetes bacterium]|nr:MFS transporter [Bacteroidota bacterium]
HENEFFGFFAFSGKFTAFLGPILVGVLAGIYDQRTGLAVVVPMFIVGGLLLLAVNEKEGIRASGRVEAA